MVDFWKMAIFHVLNLPAKVETVPNPWSFLENNAQLISICFDFQSDFLFFGPHKVDPPAQTSTAIDMSQ